MPRIFFIHGPNLNLLGERDRSIYGDLRLEDIEAELLGRAKAAGCEIEFFQSNIEGEIIDALQRAGSSSDAVVINPGGYSHTSVAIRDAMDGISVPCIEVHLSNIHAREEYRRHSVTAEAARGLISGFGPLSYYLGLDAAMELVEPSRS